LDDKNYDTKVSVTKTNYDGDGFCGPNFWINRDDWQNPIFGSYLCKGLNIYSSFIKFKNKRKK
jgi:hypothetical protein